MLTPEAEAGLSLERRGGTQGFFTKWNVKGLGRERKGGILDDPFAWINEWRIVPGPAVESEGISVETCGVWGAMQDPGRDEEKGTGSCRDWHSGEKQVPEIQS